MYLHSEYSILYIYKDSSLTHLISGFQYTHSPVRPAMCAFQANSYTWSVCLSNSQFNYVERRTFSSSYPPSVILLSLLSFNDYVSFFFVSDCILVSHSKGKTVPFWPLTWRLPLILVCVPPLPTSSTLCACPFAVLLDTYERASKRSTVQHKLIKYPLIICECLIGW